MGSGAMKAPTGSWHVGMGNHHPGLPVPIPWCWSESDVGSLWTIKEHWGRGEAVTLPTLCVPTHWSWL